MPLTRNAALVAPYAAWMALMAFLPATAGAYALRGGVTAALLAASFVMLRGRDERMLKPSACGWKGLGAGLLVGLAVLLVWIAPEMWLGFGSPVAAADSPYAPEVCGWSLTIAKIAASAFVISIAEELFFRVWMVEFAGFWWMVALFAVEHGSRWHVGALTGVVYGLLARRFGVWAAVVAHMTTNLTLGLLVVLDNRWQFW